MSTNILYELFLKNQQFFPDDFIFSLINFGKYSVNSYICTYIIKEVVKFPIRIV